MKYMTWDRKSEMRFCSKCGIDTRWEGDTCLLHNRNAVRNKHKNASRPCFKFTKGGKLVAEYSSATEAAADNGIGLSVLYLAIKRRLLRDGFFYQYDKKFVKPVKLEYF
jgi:hypothetical protein